MISIAMATYNGEKFLKEQLDSILNQTYKNFELVICDDCSTDSTPQLLNEYKNRDSRIKLFFNNCNLGFKKNFEKAVSFCTGEYIAFCDQDDVWEKTKLEDSLSNIKDKMLLSTDSLLVNSELKSLNRTFKENLGIKSISTDAEFLIKNLIHHSFIQGTTILCSSAFIKRHLPVPEDCVYHDLYFGICAALENSITYLDKTTLLYRQHENNIIGNEKKSKYSFLIPKKYDRNQIEKNAKEKICLINFLLQNVKKPELQKYLTDSKKYYEALPDKKIYTLWYVLKYSEYLIWNITLSRKILLLIKRFTGILIFKMTGFKNKHKKDISA
jgi:glycosyltransferase involved in cell wall biosynthesis